VSLGLYMDVHVHIGITLGLRRRGVDVLTAQEDGTTTLADPDLLDRATALGRVLISQDRHLLAEAAQRQRAGQTFAGLIFVHQGTIGIGPCIDELELIAKIEEHADLADRVRYLP
jgi:hypothetical protein